MSSEYVSVARPSNRRVIVLISGGGTTLKNLLEYRQRRELHCEISAVITSSPTASGLRFAEAAQIPTEYVPFGKTVDSQQAASHRVFSVCRGLDVSLVVLAGFLKHLQIPADFANRVLNIHPSLIPAFCGQGFYGHRVHQAVLDYGCHTSGCTVHFVDNQYDHGPIVAQKTVDVEPNDHADSLQQRVFAAECQLYPHVIEAYLDGRIEACGRRMRIVDRG